MKANYKLLQLLFCLTSVLGFSQESPEIINVMGQNFSGQNQIWGIAQDDNKLLYFANSDGLLCFDAANWDSLQLPEKQIVRCVGKGKNGELFAGGYGEFGFWKRDEKQHLRYTSLSKNIPLDKVHKEEIWHILVTDEAVYFQSFSTIYRYDYQKTEIITPPCNIMFLQKINQKYFIQGIGQGLFELGKTGFEYLQGSDFFAKKTIVGILPYQNEKVLVFTAKDGIFLYDFKNISVWNSGINNIFQLNQINRCTYLQNGDLVIGTILNGLYILDSQGNIKNHIAQINGLQNNTILSLFEDNDHFLWVGMDHGVDRISLHSSLRYFKDLKGNIGTTYSAALLDNRLFIGTNRGVFFKDNNNDFKFVEGTQGQVWFLQNIDNQLVCGHNDGTFLISKQGVAEKISNITGGWTIKPLPNNNAFWIEGNYTGLAIFRKDTNGKFAFQNKINGFSEPVKSLIVEDEKHIWVTNPYKGFYRLHLKNDLQEVEKIEEFAILNKQSSQVKAALTSINSKIYIQTKEGIFEYDANKKGNLEQIHQIGNTNLLNEDVHLFSGIDNDWFGVSKEKVFWQQKDQKTHFFTSLITDYECIVPLGNDKYLMGKENGYCIVDRANSAPLIAPIGSPIISKVALKNHENIYPKNQNLLSVLDWESNGIVFSFSQPEVINGVRFRYKLEGFENDWSAWQARPNKEFTNLPYGNYTFKVQSDVSDQIAYFSFKILPPWYLTLWAKIFYVALVLLGIYLLDQWYIHRLERQKRTFEHEQHQVLEQLRLQNENELLQNTIQNKTKELASSAMNVVEKNQILSKIKETLNEVKKEAGAALPSKYYQRLINAIDEHLSSEQDWLLFETNFNEVHDQFFKKLIHDFPELTPSDLKLAAYLKMNLSSKELAPIFNISIRGMENKRYRLRQKLNLHAEDNIVEFLLKYP